jgi:hypothetical protein
MDVSEEGWSEDAWKSQIQDARFKDSRCFCMKIAALELRAA